MRLLTCLLASLSLAACAISPRPAPQAAASPVSVRLIGINDVHGALDPPGLAMPAPGSSGAVRIPSGGAAYLASAIDSLRAGHPNTVVVGAGDLIGASPLSSSLFLDEPIVLALNAIGLEYSAAGNHEFDRGIPELRRIQNGGCEKYTRATPCRVDASFPGARYRILAGNTVLPDGTTLFPGTAIKSIGGVKIGFIGLTLKGTSDLVSRASLDGVHFADEADTANALVPKLKAEGADAIVVLIHQGIKTTNDWSDARCEGISGDLPAVISRLSPGVDVIVSGHTHEAYICDWKAIDPAHPLLVTSAGYKGQVVTAIDLMIDPVSHRVLTRTAQNTVVQSAPYTSGRGPVPIQPAFPVFKPRADIEVIARRYADAAKGEETRVIGSLAGPATRDKNAAGENVLGDLIADAQLAAMRAQGAEIAFMNPDGVRADILPNSDGKVVFGSAYVAQPFGNQLVNVTLTGRDIIDALEQQLNDPNWVRILLPSSGFAFAYDAARPVGSRIVSATLNGTAIDPARRYRVAMSTYLADGGDKFAAFTRGTDRATGPIELDALIDYLAKGGGTKLPALDRIANRTAR